MNVEQVREVLELQSAEGVRQNQLVIRRCKAAELLDKGVSLLQKPFSSQSSAEKVREVLDEG